MRNSSPWPLAAASGRAATKHSVRLMACLGQPPRAYAAGALTWRLIFRGGEGTASECGKRRMLMLRDQKSRRRPIEHETLKVGTKSYIWVQMNGSGSPVRLFSYAPGRGKQHGDDLWAGVRRDAMLMADGYEPYNAIARAIELVHLGCWAHYPEFSFMWSCRLSITMAARVASRKNVTRRIVVVSVSSFFSFGVCRARSARPPPAFNVPAAHTSTGVLAGLCRLPMIISFTRSARHALTRRCSVRSCTLLAYASGTIVANRSINSLADTAGSAFSHPSITGHASANGSTRVFHQCFALGCFRCVGRASPSFHAEERLARKTATSDSPAGAASARTPWAANSLNVC